MPHFPDAEIEVWRGFYDLIYSSVICQALAEHLLAADIVQGAQDFRRQRDSQSSPEQKRDM